MSDQSPERAFMQEAIRLAARGSGLASPNPQVGAIVVKNGRILGRGYHLYQERDHAEVGALREAGVDAEGADLYVTLEPCNHQGRTPPCVDLIKQRKIRRVFIALLDPNPEVAGGGAESLRASGIDVQVGLCGEEVQSQLEAYLHYSAKKQPFVVLKLAMTLDGKIAVRSGDSKWITGEDSRLRVHRLRFESDAILVGSNTIIKDNPSLDVRWEETNSIVRVVLDSSLRTPEDARLFDACDPVLLCHGPGAPETRKKTLSRYAELLELPREETGLSIPALLDELGRRGVLTLLVEGGARVAASFLRRKSVSRCFFFYGPKLVGSEGVSGVGPLEIDLMTEALEVEMESLSSLGEDILVEGRLKQK